MVLWQTFAVALTVIFIVSQVVRFYQKIKKLGNLPRLRSSISPLHPLGASLPTCSINPGIMWTWLWKDRGSRHGDDRIASIPDRIADNIHVVPRGNEVVRRHERAAGKAGGRGYPLDAVCLENTSTAKQTCTERERENRVWSPNILSEGGDEWRKHRRIMQPAFSPRTYALVCSETSRLYDEMVAAEAWTGKDSVDIPIFNTLTSKSNWPFPTRPTSPILLCIWGPSSMEVRFFQGTWEHVPPGSPVFSVEGSDYTNTYPTLDVQPAHLKLRFKLLDRAYDTVLLFLRELIASRRRELTEGPKRDSSEGDDERDTSDQRDVFRLMLEASEQEGEYALNDAELQGDTFVMLFAGHETTSHTLSVAIGFLALHSEIQDEVHEEVKSELDGNELNLDALQKLEKAQSCFVEASRVFQAGFVMIRQTQTDNVIVTHAGPEGAPDETLVLEKGTKVCVDVIGVREYPGLSDRGARADSHALKITIREYSTIRTHSSQNDGMAHRRRFALTEGTVFLARLIKDWKIEPIFLPGESRDQWKNRAFSAHIGMTLEIADVPVRLRKRV
ncbi:uncharacterized protein PHACADRAFT_186631 [Phanerochaete carnosa HHB-10118-sp]|uniref:Cytochrome P450 n=1 Tax=Phanerochaete carnosa (strain HHB-10118-sp) TaxID=650164 RepID=K5WQ67_PHACS|nr:uncharacterized protein PHACADRAFT_186631 [Phanerochaete carnosa HHB-10118-sp]EKM52487.1 hypothetical protein PHACADRAFT_186631 [Phanerochaete carnosa HHB-10118-sp]